MEYVDASSMKVEIGDSTVQGNQMCTAQTYPVLLIKVKTECKEEPDSWTVDTDHATHSHVGRHTCNADMATVKQEHFDADGKDKLINYYDGEENFDGMQEYGTADISVATYQTTQLEQGGTQNTDSLTPKQEYYDGDDDVDVKQQEYGTADISVAPSQDQVHNTREHTCDTLYRCYICDKIFGRKDKVHSRVHTGDKPYKCDVREKTFGWKSSLKVHSRIQ
jgi:hypothetical protein